MSESSFHSSFGNINFITNPDIFPIGALPKNLAEVIYEVQRKVQAPIGLIASSMLSYLLSVRATRCEVIAEAMSPPA